MKNLSLGLLLLYIYGVACYLINIVLLIQCDFSSPWKEEIIRGVGVVFPIAPMVTVWI